MDETDIKILDCLTKNGRMTTSQIAKDLYGPFDAKNLRRCDNIVRYHLKQLEKLKAVSCEEEKGIARWTISPKIRSGEMIFHAGPFRYEGKAIYVNSEDLHYLIMRE